MTFGFIQACIEKQLKKGSSSVNRLITEAAIKVGRVPRDDCNEKSFFLWTIKKCISSSDRKSRSGPAQPAGTTAVRARADCNDFITFKKSREPRTAVEYNEPFSLA